MITRAAHATLRRRRAILLVGIACATVQACFTALVGPTDATLLAVVLAALLFIALSVAGSRRARPAAFVVRTDVVAFSAPTQIWPVYSALIMVTVAGNSLGMFAHDVRADTWLWISALNAAVQVLAIVVFVTLGWKGYEVHLRPDGLYDRRIFGTLVVPWDAIRAAHPHPRRPTTIVVPPGAYDPNETSPSPERSGRVRLDYARPELVRRQGIAGTAKRLDPIPVDTRFLAAAISFYARHPEHRPGIGTEDGYRRLHQTLAGGPQ